MAFALSAAPRRASVRGAVVARTTFVARSPRRPRRTASPSPSSTRMAASTPVAASTPLFAAFCTDVPQSADKRAAARERHMEWITSPHVRTFFAGPLRESHAHPFNGSLIIVAAQHLDDAKRELAEDPFQQSVFARMQLREWRCGLVNTPLPQLMFLVWCVDRPNCLQLRADTRPKHLQWWKDARRKGIIGPFPCEGGANGTLIACSGESVDEVRQWAATDPYNQVGLFESVTVLALKNVIDTVSSS